LLLFFHCMFSCFGSKRVPVLKSQIGL
jgi:hypothetical protein